MTFTIQAVWSRREAAEELRRSLVSAGSVSVYYDFARQPMRAFAGSLFVHGGGAHVHLEDDAQLCEGFGRRVEAAIALHPDDVINFFTGTAPDTKTLPESLPGGRFIWNQCVYFPAWFAREWLAWALQVNFHPQASMRWGGMDWSVQRFLAHERRRWWRWYPSLVQHAVGPSTLNGHREPDRRTAHFVDDVGATEAD